MLRGNDDSEQCLKVSTWIFDVKIICLRPCLKESDPNFNSILYYFPVIRII